MLGAFKSPCLVQPESNRGQETAPSFCSQVLAWLPQVPGMFVLLIPNKNVFFEIWVMLSCWLGFPGQDSVTEQGYEGWAIEGAEARLI